MAICNVIYVDAQVWVLSLMNMQELLCVKKKKKKKKIFIQNNRLEFINECWQNQNESDIWLEHTEWKRKRKGKQVLPVRERKNLKKKKKKKRYTLEVLFQR